MSEVNNAGYKLEKKKISDWLTVEKLEHPVSSQFYWLWYKNSVHQYGALA